MAPDIRWFYIPFLLLAAIAIALQASLFVSADVSYLLYTANQVIEGEKYGASIFETNPPLILYLYAPAVFISKLFHFNLLSVIRIYLWIFAVGSIFTAFYFLKGIIQKEHRILLYAMAWVLTIVMLWLPGQQFGQREHILMMFSFPYVFAAVWWVNGKSQPKLLSVLMGVLAGLIFALKPYFILMPLLIEAYLLWRRRSIRLETMLMVLVMLTYFLSILLWQPGYIFTVLPLVVDFYFVGIHQPLIVVLLHPVTLFCCFILAMSLVNQKRHLYPSLLIVLQLATIGMMLAYICSQTYWHYHVMPALSFACVLLTFVISSGMCCSTAGTLDKKIYLCTAALILFLYPIDYSLSFYRYDVANAKHLQTLVNYVRQLPNTSKSISCLSLHTTADCFPLVLETNAIHASRFPFYWWTHGILVREHYPDRVPLNADYAHKEADLIAKTVDDFNHFQTDYVVLNAKDTKLYAVPPFSTLDYLLRFAEFRAVWKDYHLLATIGPYELYQRHHTQKDYAS